MLEPSLWVKWGGRPFRQGGGTHCGRMRSEVVEFYCNWEGLRVTLLFKLTKLIVFTFIYKLPKTRTSGLLV
jgi:hypothetical protein